MTEDSHARRTRLLFQKALGNDVTGGIISIPNPDYDAKHRWRYSEGVREVIGEGIAYIYAKLLFYPSVVGARKGSRTAPSVSPTEAIRTRRVGLRYGRQRCLAICPALVCLSRTLYIGSVTGRERRG